MNQIDVMKQALEALEGYEGRRAKDILRQAIEQAGKQEPFEVEWPDYHTEAMGCGLEDRNITDRYEAMQYGWDQALELVA
jgi:hypothetical protein